MKTNFLNCLKLANITPVFKNSSRNTKNMYESAFCQWILSYSKGSLANNFSKVSYLNFNVVLEKVAMLNTAC